MSLDPSQVMWSIVVLVLVCLRAGSVLAFSSGAPSSTCLSMFPKHDGATQQTASCPFSVRLQPTSYSPGDTINVTLEASSSGKMMKGFLVVAHTASGNSEQIVGRFTQVSNNTKTSNCLGGVANALTHSNNVPISSVNIQWIAPDTSVGDVVFQTTFVEDKGTFWVKQETTLTATTPRPVESGNESTVFTDIDWSGCGESKGCFLYPRTCNGDNCYAAVTYRVMNESLLEFEMFVPDQGYVAVGFSDDKEMGDDETIICWTNGSAVFLQRGYNVEERKSYERQYSAGITDVQGVYKDGRTFCRFRRPSVMTLFKSANQTTSISLSDDYYLQLAWGSMEDGSDAIKKHKELPPISDKRVKFWDNAIVRGSSLPLSKQIHGTLMLFCWMLLSNFMMVVPRHFKLGFRGKTLCGVKLWFQIHRTLAVCVWSITAASFILIFVVIGEMTEGAKNHSYLGITVMSAASVQMVLGIFRPGPDSKLRVFFNYGHWFIGKSTNIIAGVAFFLAMNIDMIVSEERFIFNVILIVYAAVAVFWEIWLDVCKGWQQKKGKEKYEMNRSSAEQYTHKMNSAWDDTKNTESEKTMQYKALVAYMSSLVVLVIAAITTLYIF